ncbi:transmembrane protein 179-like [Pomacea canaliculata]|uniref:transmembrane protein 179-like n=1 Tax=Pomacea canaliculata TaxID=400727 RepID=UPI000D73646D|nr:transmembrane protein 179-like [Pomacea canaliculata]
MGIPNKLLLAQVTLYVISFILSFFVFVPISVNLGHFGGHCLLFATGNWTSDTNAVLQSVNWGPDGACNFPIFTGVFSMLVSIIYVIWYSIFLLKETDSSWLNAAVSAFFSFILLIFSFASSLTVSSGFHDWCDLVTSPKANMLVSCADGDYIPFGKAIDVDTTFFYTEFQITQFGCWSFWICQLFLFALAVMKLYHYHRQEALPISFNRERQRLLQKVQGQSGNEYVKT